MSEEMSTKWKFPPDDFSFIQRRVQEELRKRKSPGRSLFNKSFKEIENNQNHFLNLILKISLDQIKEIIN